ncbi:MAG TPA: cupredoxin domain-containing protein [Gaiellaceae bacterium]|nr:cupredoxin domain-containing protein [Gaiellaceae bacterium]
MFLGTIIRGTERGTRAVGTREVRIRVRGGYEPSTVVARAGERLRLTFRREDRLACTEEVVFPHFGRSATLPAGEEVTVELLLEEPGEYAFTCGWGMLCGRLVVRGEAAPSGTTPPSGRSGG